jgi:hypothetical protein
MHLTPEFVVGRQVHYPSHETHATSNPNHLLEGNETGGVSGTNTGPSVLDGLAAWLLAVVPGLYKFAEGYAL